MGNALVCSIHPDHGYTLQAGEPFTGKVFVNVHRRIPAFQAFLILEGREIHKHGSRTFFKTQVNLQNPMWTGKLPPAHYAFPFTIQLPASLPNSFSVEEFCRILYNVSVFGNRKRHKSVLITSLNITVRSAPLPNELVPLVVSPQTFDIKAARISQLHRGQITLAARLEDAHVGKGNFLKVYLAGYNSSRRNINKVTLELFETIWLIHPSRNPGRTIKKARNIFLPNLYTVPDFAPIDESNISEEDRFRIVYQRLEAGETSLAIKIPYDARDSYEGNIIKVTHTLRINFMTRALNTNPRIEIPLRIGRAPSGTSLAPATPVSSLTTQVLDPGSINTNAPDDYDDIPIVTAAPLPVSDNEAPMSTEDVIVIGGDTIVYSERGLSSLDDYIELEALPVPSNHDGQEHSMENVLRAMTASIYDYDILSNYLQDPEWIAFFNGISAEQFANIIGHVNIDPDQVRVARLLAPHLNNGAGVNGQFIALALRNTAQSHRINLVEALLPFRMNSAGADDLGVIRDELTRWELVVLDSRLL